MKEEESFGHEKIYISGMFGDNCGRLVFGQKSRYFSAERGSVAGNFHGYGQGDGKRKGMLHCQDSRF